MTQQIWSYFHCLCLVALSFCLSAQTVRTTSEILASASSEPAIARQDRMVDYLKNTNHELPWVNKMEFRTETDEMDWERQEYLYRLGLNSTEERNAQRKLHQTNVQLAEIETQQRLHEELMRRYLQLLEYRALEEEIRLVEQQKLIATDQLKVLKALASAEGTLNLPTLISTEDELHEYELALKELNDKLTLTSVKLQLAAGDAIDFENLLGLEDIRAMVSQLTTTPDDPGAQQRRAEIEMSLAEYGFEVARNQRILDFVQVRYAGRDNLNFTRELAFGMAFNIPVKSADRLDLNELELERIENENRLEAYLLGQAERLAETTQEINLLFENHDLATRQLRESQTSFSLENYPQIADADPLVLLKIKKSELKRQLTLSDIEKDIYTTYLELLEISGKVTERPLKNYLTPNLEIIQ